MEDRGCLACCSPRDHKESDTARQLNNHHPKGGCAFIPRRRVVMQLVLGHIAGLGNQEGHPRTSLTHSARTGSLGFSVDPLTFQLGAQSLRAGREILGRSTGSSEASALAQPRAGGGKVSSGDFRMQSPGHHRGPDPGRAPGERGLHSQAEGSPHTAPTADRSAGPGALGLNICS